MRTPTKRTVLRTPRTLKRLDCETEREFPQILPKMAPNIAAADMFGVEYSYDLPLYMAVTQQTEVQLPKNEETGEPAKWVKDDAWPDIHLERSYVGRVSIPLLLTLRKAGWGY